MKLKQELTSHGLTPEHAGSIGVNHWEPRDLPSRLTLRPLQRPLCLRACGVGMEAFGSPICAHAIVPPLITISGLAPKSSGFHSTRSASFPACICTHPARANAYMARDHGSTARGRRAFPPATRAPCPERRRPNSPSSVNPHPPNRPPHPSPEMCESGKERGKEREREGEIESTGGMPEAS